METFGQRRQIFALCLLQIKKLKMPQHEHMERHCKRFGVKPEKKRGSTGSQGIRVCSVVIWFEGKYVQSEKV